MKRFFIISLLCLTSLFVFAQIQQGIVKTRGRVVNGKVVPGTRLNGATITLNFGNPLVSGQNGAFSFNVPSGKNYSLVTAKKQGYTLADPEFTHRSFSYSSSNPFYVVLEDEQQRMADINVATRKVRRTLTTQLQAREDEIESLKEQNKLTEEEYQKRLQRLYDSQSKSEQLVKDMAERYASTDYDQLDEFNQLVLQYIDEGELLKAESLINTRGSLEKRFARVKAQERVNIQREDEIRMQQESLAKSRDLTLCEKEDLMSDLYAKHTIYLQTYQQDSAMYCMKMRADLDTTNILSVTQYADLAMKQQEYSEAELYYFILLRIFYENKDTLNTVVIQNNLGNLYADVLHYVQSERYYQMALTNAKHLFAINHLLYKEKVAMILSNLANLYRSLHQYDKSKKYFQDAQNFYKELFCENPDKYSRNFSITQTNFAILYEETGYYDKADSLYTLVLNREEEKYLGAPEENWFYIAKLLNNLGSLNLKNKNYVASAYFLQRALALYETKFYNNPYIYDYALFLTFKNIIQVYEDINDSENSNLYLKKKNEYIENLYLSRPTDRYRRMIINSYIELAESFYRLQHFKDSEEYYSV